MCDGIRVIVVTSEPSPRSSSDIFVWRQEPGDEAVITTFIWQIIHTDETQGRERSHQSGRGEQYDDEPDREDRNRERKRQKTKHHQEGQLTSDSGPQSLAGEGDLRRRKKDRPSPKLELPPEDDNESDTNTPPPAEGNGEQNTNNEGSEEGSKQKESKGSNLNVKLSTKELNSEITNMNEPTTKHAINCFVLMFIVIAIVFILGVCAYTYINAIYQK